MDKTSRAYVILEEIARNHLNLDTLEIQGSDSLDFKEQSVWQIKDALEAAFDAGYKMCAEVRGSRSG